MARFKIKEKLFSIADKFFINNEFDELIYMVEGKFFSIGKKFNLLDQQEQNKAHIAQKLLAFRPTFSVTFADGSKAKVMKTFLPIFHSRFLIEYQNRRYTVLGNFLAHEYDITYQGEQIASVSKQWFAFADTYGVDIKYAEDEALILSTVIIIDAVHHGASDD